MILVCGATTKAWPFLALANFTGVFRGLPCFRISSREMLFSGTVPLGDAVIHGRGEALVTPEVGVTVATPQAIISHDMRTVLDLCHAAQKSV
jgi:hypothetical protein